MNETLFETLGNFIICVVFYINMHVGTRGSYSWALSCLDHPNPPTPTPPLSFLTLHFWNGFKGTSHHWAPLHASLSDSVFILSPLWQSPHRLSHFFPRLVFVFPCSLVPPPPHTHTVGFSSLETLLLETRFAKMTSGSPVFHISPC